MSNSELSIALIFGGRSAEHEVSILSARSIYNAFDKNKYNIYPIAISKQGNWLNTEASAEILNSSSEEVNENGFSKLISQDILDFLQNKIELVFPVLHGPYGEDGKLQGFLDILNIPYVGCDLTASAVGMDKEIMKKLFDYHKIPQTKFEILREFEYKKSESEELYKRLENKLGKQFFVKPANMGSSIGITRVGNTDDFAEAVAEAFKYDKKLIFEKAVDGRELEAAVLGSEGDIKVSVPGEIVSTHDFYDYVAKYKDSATSLHIPADVGENTAQKIKETAAEVFNAVGASGLARIDFFLSDNNRVLVNEINTMPGFTKFSMYPLLFEESGISYSELLDKLVDIALKKVK